MYKKYDEIGVPKTPIIIEKSGIVADMTFSFAQ